MTDPGVDDLHYGHFGQAVYDVDNKTWVFKRTPGVRRVFLPLGPHHTEIPASASEIGFCTNLATELDSQQKHLLALNPELRSAAHLLSRAAQISEAVNATASSFDPQTSDLLAFGRAADVDNKRFKGTVKIATLPGGPAGDSLRLVRLQVERHGWSRDKSIWLKVPTLQHGDVGWWPGDGTPILQISCASQINDRGTFIAVRTARSVNIFRPLYHRLPVPPKGTGSLHAFPPSRLEANLLASLALSVEEPGFADVTFNPWYQRQFATLDQEGNWSVYDIEGRRGKRGLDYHAARTKSGRLEFPRSSSDLHEGTLSGHYDGWGRILWANDVSTILVCNRRVLGFFDFNDRAVFLSPSSLRLAGTSSWILDVKRDPRNSERVLVLTSTNLLVLRVPKLVREGKVEWTDSEILLSWRHFLNEEDTTMQISAFVEGEDTVVFLRSESMRGLLAFRYRQHADVDFLVSGSDPAWLFRSIQSSSLRGIHLDALEIGEDPSATMSGPGKDYREHGIQFFSFYMLSRTLEASRMLAFTSDKLRGSLTQQQTSVECPSWITRIATQSSTRVLDDSFIVPDDLEELEEEPSFPQWRKRTAARRPAGPVYRDYSRVYEVIRELDKLPKEDAAVVISELRDDIASMSPLNCRQNTLLHLANLDFRFDVTDIDETSAAFSELVSTRFNQEDEEASVTIKPVDLPSLHEYVMFEDGAPSVVLTYEKILRWAMSRLPPDTAARKRLEAERLARRIAVKSCLASVKLSLQQPEPQAEVIEESQLMDESGLTSPLANRGEVKGATRRGSLGLQSSEPDFSQVSTYALPTPEPTPSLASEATYASSVSTCTNSSFVDRLSQYGVTVASERKQVRELPAIGKQVLARWRVGEEYRINRDESDFSFGRGKRKSGLNDPGISAKEREKLLKQAEKRAKRQRRETELFYQSQQSVSQTPRLTVVSQPRPAPMERFSSPVRGPRSSQVGPSSSQMLPSTQVERGTHGGRPKKKRRRTEGF